MAESKLLATQCGIRSTKQIMTLCFPLNAARTQNRSQTIVLVDYCKAFDAVDTTSIPVVLRHYGVPDPTVADVMQLYHGSSAAVLNRFRLT